jgi:CBS domain-containing protein/mannitol/fructose-specific phosphotransferase system IIA component (Ntr-type)
MLLRELLPAGHVFVPLPAATLGEALATMTAALGRAGVLHEPEQVNRMLLGPRSRAIVPIGERAVLPHLRTDGVERLVLALGVAAGPLDAREFGLAVAPRLIALILAPPDAASLYLQTMATIARLLRRDELVEALLRARDAADVLRLTDLADARIQASLTVRDLMSQRAPVPPAAPVRDVVSIMIERGVRALPVVGEKGEVLGIITEWDIMRALLPQVPGQDHDDASARVPADLTARDIMTRSVLCIAEDMGLYEAANLMINKDVEQFPVVGEGKLVGFLSRGDIIRKLFGR